MNERLTDQQLAAIEARVAAIGGWMFLELYENGGGDRPTLSGGPFVGWYDISDRDYRLCTLGEVTDDHLVITEGGGISEAAIELIENAPEDITALLAEVRESRRMLDAMSQDGTPAYDLGRAVGRAERDAEMQSPD